MLQKKTLKENCLEGGEIIIGLQIGLLIKGTLLVRGGT